MLKQLIAGIITHSLIGRLIGMFFGNNIPNLRYPNLRFEFPPNYNNHKIKAYLFWGLYESAELRLLKKHLPSDTSIIELGSSIGVVASFAASLIDPKNSLTSVEANPNLLKTIKNNMVRNNPNFHNHKVLHAAIKYNADTVSFAISHNTTASRINLGSNSISDISVKTISLNELSLDFSQYTLICDIEGAEIEILLYDKEALLRCQHLFIELHKTSYNNQEYSVEDLNELLINIHNFNLVDRDGNVFYYTRKDTE